MENNEILMENAETVLVEGAESLFDGKGKTIAGVGLGTALIGGLMYAGFKLYKRKANKVETSESTTVEVVPEDEN